MRRVELTPLIAAAAAGFAAWISIGSLAVASTSTASRIGFLAPFWLAPLLMAAFASAAWASNLTRSTSLPLFFSLVLVLPWIPGQVPAAFFLWTGPIVFAVWLAVIVGMISAGSQIVVKKRSKLFGSGYTAGAVAFALYLAGGWSLSAILPGGDEPHYLVITQSLLRDGDIRIENNYAQGQYLEYIGVPQRPQYLKRGINGDIYSIHAPGLPAVVAPAFALFGYPGVVVFLSLVAAVGSAMLWRSAHLLTGSVSAAWFAWAAGALTVPFFFEAFAVFPDGIGATLVLFAAFPLFQERVSSRRWVAIGAALGLLPWLHTRFSVISAMLGLVLFLRLAASRNGRSRIAAFLVVPITAAIAWFSFFRIVYGTFDPAAPYGRGTQTRAMNILNGLPALVFDQQFGILPNAPVYAFCFFGLGVLARRHWRVALELSIVSLAYLLSVSTFHMWWGGFSAPARFLAPILPLLAIPGAWLWSTTPSRATRACALTALAISLLATAIMAGVGGGFLVYNVRDGYARALEWLNPVIDLSRGMPSFFRQTSSGAVLRAAIWIAFGGSAVFALRVLERTGVGRGAFALATSAALALAMMGALTAVWAMDDVAAPNPEKSQLSLLGAFDTTLRPNGVAMQPPQMMRLQAAGEVLSMIVVATPTRREPAGESTLLLMAPAIIPGGTYEVRPVGEAPSAGTARLVIGRQARPARTWDLAADFRDGPEELDLAVSVGSLVIAGDSGVGRSGGSLTLRPTKVWEGRSRLTGDIARRVERYGPALVFFFDSNTFPEDPGFWVRGGRRTQVAVSPVEDRAPLQLFVRNAAAANEVRIEIDGAEQTLNLQPSEERTLAIPIDENRPGALIRIYSQSGFRPSEVEKGSTDTRFLGTWIELR